MMDILQVTLDRIARIISSNEGKMTRRQLKDRITFEFPYLKISYTNVYKILINGKFLYRFNVRAEDREENLSAAKIYTKFI